MKKIILNLLFIVILLPATAQESGIRFFHGTWDEAVALAKKEKKKIFVDFFTEWCGPCLNMALTVFPLPEVGETYNKNFICLKIDAEKAKDGNWQRNTEFILTRLTFLLTRKRRK